MTFGSKAAFRAARERCGISQKMLADRFGNAVMTVKRWEKPGEAEPPADVQAWLEHMLSQHVEAVEAALDAVDGIEEVQGNPPDHVDLTYYRSQAHYDEFGRDEAVYSVINARSREIGAILQAEGYTVRYVYPEDADTVSTLGGRDVQA